MWKVDKGVNNFVIKTLQCIALFNFFHHTTPHFFLYSTAQTPYFLHFFATQHSTFERFRDALDSCRDFVMLSFVVRLWKFWTSVEDLIIVNYTWDLNKRSRVLGGRSIWYLPRIYSICWRIPLQDSGSFGRDPPHLTLNHGFLIIRLSRPEEFA
jgi:hypothetical protein